MSTRVRVVCRPATVTGLALAGLEVEVARDAGEAAARLRQHAADRAVGLVLVDEVLYRGLPGELRARLDRSAQPVVAPFPAPAWDAKEAAEEYVLELLRQAIGYRVRAR